MNVRFGYDRAGLALDAYAAVAAAYGGPPEWVGRYLEHIPGTSNGLSVAEVGAIHAKGMPIAVCYNGANPGDVTGSVQGGQDNAAVAVRHAQAIGIPTGVALFLDVEAGWAPSVAFFTGWFLGCHGGGYVPACYLNAQDAAHVVPFLAAMQATGIAGVIWSSEPEFTSELNIRKTDWYDFSQTPLGAHAAVCVLHQYGENELGGQVDLDVCNDAGWAVLWHSAPVKPPVQHYPYSARVLKPGDLKQAASHESKPAIDKRHRDVILHVAEKEVRVTGPAVADPNGRDWWLPCHLAPPETAVKGWFLRDSLKADDAVPSP